MSRQLAVRALEIAELVAKSMPEGTGISIVLSTDGGRIGVASNVDPDELVKAITSWASQAKAAKAKRGQT